MRSKILLNLVVVFFTLVPDFSHAQWFSFGSSLPPFVIGFENDTVTNTLYGYGQPSPYPYEWNGIDWQASNMPLPNSGGIHKIKLIDSTLFAVTYATTNFNHVYFKQGNNWLPLGGEFKNIGSTFLPTLYDLIKYNNELYVIGDFNRVDVDTINGIAKWNGTNWVSLGSGLQQGLPPYNNLLYPHQFLNFNNQLVVSGNFINAGGNAANGIAAWDGSQWNVFSSGFNKVVYGMEIFNGELYVGGEFTQSGATALGCISKWNGSAWVDPGFQFSVSGMPGFNPYIHSLKSIGSKLYIGGGFNRLSDLSGTHLSRGIVSYDGLNIDTLDGGVNSDVEAILPFQNGILVGGDFTIAGTTPVTNVAFLQNPTGYSSFDPKKSFEVSPNPFNEKCIIKIPNLSLDEIEIKCFDNLGHEFYPGITFRENEIEISNRGLDAGIYFIAINQSNKLLSNIKIIVY